MDHLLTNCPNCAGVLTSDGFCEYCNTKVRYANVLELSDIDREEIVEILIKMRDKDRVSVLPVKGFITSIEMKMNASELLYDDYRMTRITNLPEININFDGWVDNYMENRR